MRQYTNALSIGKIKGVYQGLLSQPRTIEQEAKRYSILALLVSAVSFLIFKICYPSADFFSDSYSYIFAAKEGLYTNIWPIGYSIFLRLLHFVSPSDLLVVSVQYILLQASILIFFRILLEMTHITGWKLKALFALFFINPFTLYLSNTINSDALFGAMSLFWLSSLLLLRTKPLYKYAVLHASVLVLCFTIRNNSYYYPIISLVTLFLYKIKPSIRYATIFLSLALVIGYINLQSNETYKLTGKRQYSLFTGWQLANNALYLYNQVEIDSFRFNTQEEKELNRISIQFFRRINTPSFSTTLNDYVGNFFIRQPESPLKEYYRVHFHPNNELENIKSWAMCSESYQRFGKQILTDHPLAFAQYFVLPNLINYAVPPLSHLAKYVYGIDQVDPIAKDWFNYSSTKVSCISNVLQGNILSIYPYLFLFLNFYVAFLLFRHYFILRGKKQPIVELLINILTLLFVLNLGFSLISTSNILRYQYFPLIFIATLCSLLIELQFPDEKDSSKKVSHATI